MISFLCCCILWIGCFVSILSDLNSKNKYRGWMIMAFSTLLLAIYAAINSNIILLIFNCIMFGVECAVIWYLKKLYNKRTMSKRELFLNEIKEKYVSK